jgi:hypothetical protein
MSMSMNEVVKDLYAQIDGLQAQLTAKSSLLLQADIRNRKVTEQLKELEEYRDAHIHYTEN